MELSEFLKQTQNEVRDEMRVRSTQPGIDVPFPELIFTEVITRHMTDIGMTFDEPEICHCNDLRVGPGGASVRLSGFCFSEEQDQLDLFVTIYRGTDDLISIPDSETAKAAEACSRFLSTCVEGKLSSKIDESHDAYTFILTLEKNYPDLDQIRIYILTDGQVKTRNFKSREIQGKTIKLEVVDIVRLYNHWQEGKPRDELVVNFEEVSGDALPCVWVPGEMGEYDYAMTVIPGEALRFLYEKYGTRILEANVRSFLSQTGKVNKGISNTLREQPERFMAYNNGIVIVADEARLGKSQDGNTGITWLKGMQIVNGGQTTASMFFTKKKFPSTDLSNVRVPAKIIVLRETDPAQEEALISDISRYANSQNKVNTSDLSANRPFHVAIEKLANSTYCPDGYSRWFYERASGSYKVLLEKEGKTPAGIKKIQESIPSSRRITKTDLAKYLCAWKQRPDLVSLGGQKNFSAFMNMIDKNANINEDLPDVDSYKKIVAQIIIFKDIQKSIRPLYPAFQANIVAYTVALLSKMHGESIDLIKVWNNQCISKVLKDFSINLSKRVNNVLHDTAKGKMVSEWAKKEECWNIISSLDYSDFSFENDC